MYVPHISHAVGLKSVYPKTKHTHFVSITLTYLLRIVTRRHTTKRISEQSTMIIHYRVKVHSFNIMEIKNRIFFTHEFLARTEYT